MNHAELQTALKEEAVLSVDLRGRIRSLTAKKEALLGELATSPTNKSGES